MRVKFISGILLFLGKGVYSSYFFSRTLGARENVMQLEKNPYVLYEKTSNKVYLLLIE